MTSLHDESVLSCSQPFRTSPLVTTSPDHVSDLQSQFQNFDMVGTGMKTGEKFSAQHADSDKKKLAQELVDSDKTPD